VPNEGLDLLATNSEHGRDLLVRLAAEFEQHQRRALIGGQPPDVLDNLAELLAARDQARRTIDRGTVSAEPVAVRNLATGAQLRQAAIARDRIQPRPQRTVTATATKRLVCRHQRQLQRVLAPLPASQHMHTEAEQRRTVTIENLLERLIVAGPDPRHKLLVGEAARTRRSRVANRQSHRAHGRSIGVTRSAERARSVN
jgi:hypothetical protein